MPVDQEREAVSESTLIPNFRRFDLTRYAGGVPTPDGWKYIVTLGVTDVWKFDEPEESSDAIAVALGLRVHYYPIGVMQQILVGPNDKDFRQAVKEIYECPTPIFVHCGSVARTAQWLKDSNDSVAGGNDRTGLAVGCYMLWYGGFDKASAFAVMLRYGFHRLLLGLCLYWSRA